MPDNAYGRFWGLIGRVRNAARNAGVRNVHIPEVRDRDWDDMSDGERGYALDCLYELMQLEPGTDEYDRAFNEYLRSIRT